MLVLQCHIEITSKDTQNILKFDYVNSVSIKTSMGTLKYVKAENVKLIIKAKSLIGKKKLETQSPKDAKEGEVREKETIKTYSPLQIFKRAQTNPSGRNAAIISGKTEASVSLKME